LGRRIGCQKIDARGVLSVNGNKIRPESGVLKVEAEWPLSQSGPEPSRFDALFAEFYPELFGLVYRALGDRMETEDVLQEAFLKLSYDDAVQRRPDAEVGAWLRRVGLNVAFNRLRSAKRARARLERVGRMEPSDDDASEMDGPSGIVLRREQREIVRQALAEVPERQRECLLLRHSGYSYAEIAATLGVAIGSVGVLLARGEQAFRAQFRRLQTHP
jgi:RNA polymerase sigma factor (sigma-70 family)